MSYTKTDLIQCAQKLEAMYGVVASKVDDLNYEFLSDGGLRLFRVILQETDLCISFYIDLTSPVAIEIFNSLQPYYTDLKVSESYYISTDGMLYRGDDAYLMQENDKQLNDVENGTTIYDPVEPISFASNECIYEAHHPDAQKAFKIFKDRKKIY